MKYIFENKSTEVVDTSGSLVLKPSDYFTMFEVKDGQRKKIKEFKPSKRTATEVKVALICQLIANGKTLEGIRTYDWVPTKTEFFVWVEKDIVYKSWYKQACKYRTLMLVDKLYAKVLKDIKEGKPVFETTRTLKEILHYIKSDETEDSGDRVLIHSQEIRPKVFDQIKSTERE